MEQKMKEVNVEMTVEEAAELFSLYGNRRGNFRFIPKSLSELVNDSCLVRGSDVIKYSSGDVYLSRQEGKKIEFVKISMLCEEFLNHKSPVKRMPQIPHGKRLSVPGYAIYPYQDFLYLDRMGKCLFAEKKDEIFELPIMGNVCLDEASNLPFWENKVDFERLSRSYGNENHKKIMMSNELFYLISGGVLKKRYNLFTIGFNNCFKLSPKVIHPLEEAKDFYLKGTIQIPNIEDNNLEKHLIQDYVKPQNPGNGVIVMNEDRIPKYLQRRLGLGG